MQASISLKAILFGSGDTQTDGLKDCSERIFKDRHTHARAPPPHTHTFTSHSFQGIRWIFATLLLKINVSRCVACVYYQFHPPTLPLPLATLLHFPFSRPPLPCSSLSPMNRLNFLMSCFYGLLMLIQSSPYALSLHPSVSCCLPPTIHPSQPSPRLHQLLFRLQQCLHVQKLGT